MPQIRTRFFFLSTARDIAEAEGRNQNKTTGALFCSAESPFLVVLSTIWHCTRPRNSARRRRTGGVRSPNHKPTETRRDAGVICADAVVDDGGAVCADEPAEVPEAAPASDEEPAEEPAAEESQQLARSVALLPFRSDREVRSETARTVPLRVLGRASQCEPQSDCRARSSLPGNRLRLRRPRALQMTIRPSCRHRRSLPSR